MENLIKTIFTPIYNVVWGMPVLVLLVGCGIYLTVKTRFIAFRKFPFIVKNTLFKIFEKEHHGEGNLSPFQALATALAATVGTGNIVGVSGAILLGGPGAVFWMWVAALFGMSTKMAEATLAVAYRDVDSDGRVAGGPMFYISKGLNWRWLGKTFAFLGTFATLGIGNTVQANAISETLYLTFRIPKLASGIVVAVIVFAVIIGGIKRIGSFAEKLVPFMSVFYILGGIIVLILHRENLGVAFASIFKEAFNIRSAGGGVAGYTMLVAMRNGVARGVFTNEAGLGSSPIAHAAATSDHPSRQGMWGVFEVFMDTIVVCTITALVILSTGLWEQHENAASLVAYCFSEGFAGGRYLVSIGLALFALTTILGWAYYGESCCRYFFGQKSGIIYKLIFVPLIVVGAVIKLDLIWLIADSLNGLMAIPNLIGLFGLSGVVYRLQKDFYADPLRIRKDNAEWEQVLSK
ncbi:MAG: sodium:alanine symporter family protein [Eubacteriales bacterium]|nr:sodium:alanine symporter family protein [Eubacteriales bacterium]